MVQIKLVLAACSAVSSKLRMVGVVSVCVLAQACGPDGPAPGPPNGAPAAAQGALARFDRLQQSLDRLIELLAQDDTSAEGNAEIQRELETVQEFAGGSGPGAPPFQAKLQRIVSILSESGNGTVSPQEKNDVKAEILAIKEMLDAGVDIDSIAPSAAGTSSPPPGPGGAGPPGAGPGFSPPAGPGGPGPGGPMGSGGPDASTMQMEMERTQRNVEEKLWRARASATRMAVEQTRAAYDQAMNLHPGPASGMSPQQVDQAKAAAKAANDAAVKAEGDLREQARREAVPPGWLR